MKQRLSYLILPTLTLALEASPYGAVCNFANPNGESFRKTFSYFDLTPYGYANFTPLLTAMITCVIFVLIAVYCIRGNVRTAIWAKNILFVAVAVSLGPLFFDITSFSLVGGLITLSLLEELLLLQFTVKKSKA